MPGVRVSSFFSTFEMSKLTLRIIRRRRRLPTTLGGKLKMPCEMLARAKEKTLCARAPGVVPIHSAYARDHHKLSAQLAGSSTSSLESTSADGREGRPGRGGAGRRDQHR